MRRRYLAAGALVAVLATASGAHAQIAVSIAAPTASQAVGDTLSVSGTVQSQFALSEATATVQAANAALTISNATKFAGTLDIAAVPIGPQTLTVSVKDAYGTTGSAQVSFVHDRPPSVVITSPLDWSVARPSIRLAASCVDLDMYGCTSIKAVVGANVVASGTTSFDQVVSLGAFKGQRLNLLFTATDSAGMSMTVTRTVFVESSARLFEVDTVAGQILDVDATRILYTVDGALRIRTRGSQNEVTVLASSAPSAARLTTSGALWNEAEWNGTQVVSLPAGQWIAKGNTACGVLPSSGDRGTGVVRDLSTGVTTTVFPASEGLYATCADVAENGDVLFHRVDGLAQQAYRYRTGVLTRVSNGTTRTMGSLTDGTNVVYQYYYAGGSSAGTRLATPDGEAVLGGAATSMYAPRADYAVAGGVAAFIDFAAGTPFTVFLRSSTGTVAQVGAFATRTSIDWNGHGNAVTQGDVIHGDTVSVINDGKRYLAKPGIPPDAISSALGGARYVGSDWHVVLGRSLFKIVPPGFDAGAPDGGSDDAGPVDGGPDDAGMPDGTAPDARASDADVPSGDDASTLPPGLDDAVAPAGAPGEPPDDGACSATRRGPIGAGVGPALLALLAVLRLARRDRRI